MGSFQAKENLIYLLVGILSIAQSAVLAMPAVLGRHLDCRVRVHPPESVDGIPPQSGPGASRRPLGRKRSFRLAAL